MVERRPTRKIKVASQQDDAKAPAKKAKRSLSRTGKIVDVPSETRISTAEEQIADVDKALTQQGFTQTFSPKQVEAALGEKKSVKRKTGDVGEDGGKTASVKPIVEMRNVCFSYPDDPDTKVLDGIDLKIMPGECVFVVGMSGAGKTSLIRMLNRTIKPTSGEIEIAGQDIVGLSENVVPYLRRQVGTVFQDYKLLPNKTVYENVAFALRCISKSHSVIEQQVPEVLRLVGLSEKANAYPHQLSGGEQQRVSIARAMVNRPPLLICDEPTGNLDPAISVGIMRLLMRINQTGTTIIVSTHDKNMVDAMQKRVIEIADGKITRDTRGGYLG